MGSLPGWGDQESTPMHAPAGGKTTVIGIYVKKERKLRRNE